MPLPSRLHDALINSVCVADWNGESDVLNSFRCYECVIFEGLKRKTLINTHNLYFLKMKLKNFNMSFNFKNTHLDIK